MTTLKTALPGRNSFPVLRPVPTRWMDNDIYGHVNNVTYYSYFDTAVNGLMAARGFLRLGTDSQIGIVAETSCRFLKSVAFPDALEVGIAVEKLGRTSVIYRLGIFAEGDPALCALGRFVHVYVRPHSHVPEAIAGETRAFLESLVVPGAADW